MRTPSRGAPAASGVLLLTACATHVAHVETPLPDHARVDYALVQQTNQPQYQMDERTLFVMPSELESPPPEFPADVAPGDVAPVTVCVEVWLDAAGRATRLGPARRGDGCPGEDDAGLAPYELASVRGMRAWSFSAAAICHFPAHLSAQRERGDCRGSEVVLERVPVRLTYAFTFERHSGRARVRTGAKP